MDMQFVIFGIGLIIILIVLYRDRRKQAEMQKIKEANAPIEAAAAAAAWAASELNPESSNFSQEAYDTFLENLENLKFDTLNSQTN